MELAILPDGVGSELRVMALLVVPAFVFRRFEHPCAALVGE